MNQLRVTYISITKRGILVERRRVRREVHKQASTLVFVIDLLPHPTPQRIFKEVKHQADYTMAGNGTEAE